MAARRGEGQKGRASRGQSPKPPARGSPLLDVSPLPPQTSSERRPGAAAEAAPTLHRRPPPPPGAAFPRRPPPPDAAAASAAAAAARRPASRPPPPRVEPRPPAAARRSARPRVWRCAPTTPSRRPPPLPPLPPPLRPDARRPPLPDVARHSWCDVGAVCAAGNRRWRGPGPGLCLPTVGGGAESGRGGRFILDGAPRKKRGKKNRKVVGAWREPRPWRGACTEGGTTRAERRSAGSGAPSSLTMLPHTSRCYRYRGAGWTPPCRGPLRTRRAPPPLPTPASHCPKAGRPASAAAPSAAQCAAAARHTRAETRPHGRHAGPKPGLPTWCGGLVTDAQVPTRVPHRRAPRSRHGPPLAALDSRAAPPRLCVACRVQHRIALARDGRRDWSHLVVVPLPRLLPRSPSPIWWG